MRSWGALLRRCETALLSSQETPRDAARALAVGVFLSFSPLLGFQIALAALAAWAFKLNRILLFVGLCMNLPWLVAPYYAATTGAAAWVMGVSPPSQLTTRLGSVFSHSVVSRTFWSELAEVLLPLLWPFVAGSTVAAALLALVAYQLALAVATRRRAAATGV